MTITLDPATEQFVQRALDRGAFATADEAVACAVRLLASEQTDDDWPSENRDAIRAALEESFAAEARGESYTPEQVQAILSENRAKRRSRAA